MKHYRNKKKKYLIRKICMLNKDYKYFKNIDWLPF